MTDALSAADQFGVEADLFKLHTDPFTLEQLEDCAYYDVNGAEQFLVMVNRMGAPEQRF